MKAELKSADFLRGYLIDLNLCDEISKLTISENVRIISPVLKFKEQVKTVGA